MLKHNTYIYIYDIIIYAHYIRVSFAENRITIQLLNSAGDGNRISFGSSACKVYCAWGRGGGVRKD